MLARFSERARRVIVPATDEARRRGYGRMILRQPTADSVRPIATSKWRVDP